MYEMLVKQNKKEKNQVYGNEWMYSKVILVYIENEYYIIAAAKTVATANPLQININTHEQSFTYAAFSNCGF